MKRNSPWLPPLMLFVAALSAVLVVPEVSGIDESVRVRVADALVSRGEVNIPFWVGHDDEYINVYYNRERNRHYGLWNLGQSLVLAPFVAAGNAAATLGSDATERDLWRGAFIAVGYAAFINALLAWVSFGVLRRMRLSRRSAALGVLCLLFFGQWLVWGHSLQEESLCALLLMTALWLGLKSRQGSWLACALGMGACFGFLANVRFNGAFCALALLLWIMLLSGRSRALKIAIAAVAAALPFAVLWLWYNYARTGDALASPYVLNLRLMRDELGVDTRWQPTPLRLWSFLFGYDNGALWFGLPLLLLPVLWRRGRAWLGTGALMLLLALVAHTLMICGFYAGTGVQGAGSPRYLAHQLMVLGPFWFVALRRAWVLARRQARFRLLAPVVMVLCVASLMFQASARLLHPELEATQDVFYELSGERPPLPYHHLPRRLKNLGLALTGDLTEFTYPAGFSTRNHEIPRNPAGEARHTMLSLPPAYFLFLERFSGPLPQQGRALAWGGWWGALGLCVASAAWLGLRLHKARPSQAAQRG